MTCVVGLVAGKSVWMGADSLAFEDSSGGVVGRSDEKVFAIGNSKGVAKMLIGFAGSFRVGQVLRYGVKYPSKPGNMDLDRYMVTHYVDAVRSGLSDRGSLSSKDGVDFCDGTWLVAIEGRLFHVMSDFQIEESRHPFAATGAADEIALGSLFSSRGRARERVEEALRAAETFSGTVRSPFVIHRL